MATLINRIVRDRYLIVLTASFALFLFSVVDSLRAAPAKPVFRAGAAAVDITPAKFPVVVNGMFNARSATQAHDRLMSRALVLDDGRTRIAIVIVDNLMIPRELLDEAKKLASRPSGVPAERMLIAATHTHSAPSVMGCLGSGADPDYPPQLVRHIARSIEQASKQLRPAQVGWAVIEDKANTHCRRWIRRPDRLGSDPFGVQNVRAMMHPGYQNPNSIAPAGPDDPDLSLLSIQSIEGRPLAVLANYAMHYYGSPLISGDACGRFGSKLAALLDVEQDDPAFVGILSQGTSGDIMWMDYARPRQNPGLDAYTESLARKAKAAMAKIQYHRHVPLAMREARLKLKRRVPDAQRLAWARKVVAELGDGPPRGMAQIYAREQIYLHQQPQRELKLQVIRIGELGITAIPDEVYAITGLKLKRQSPLAPTFNIELANGAEGYIPPPEQHKLGGYTTWPARTAGLEEQAEPKIVAELLRLLEEVSAKPRRPLVEMHGEYAKAVLTSKPRAYYRLNEIAGRAVQDAAGKNHARYEDGVALYLPGPQSPAFSANQVNRAPHFAGGRVAGEIDKLGETYSVELWLWNGLPAGARAVTGYCFSRGAAHVKNAPGDHLGIGGTAGAEGKLILFNGNDQDEFLRGKTRLELKTWYHVVLVRAASRVAVYLNGAATPEIEGEAKSGNADDTPGFFIGGRCDNFANFEGKIDEVALYDRALSVEEIQRHYEIGKVGNAN